MLSKFEQKIICCVRTTTFSCTGIHQDNPDQNVFTSPHYSDGTPHATNDISLLFNADRHDLQFLVVCRSHPRFNSGLLLLRMEKNQYRRCFRSLPLTYIPEDDLSDSQA